MPKSVLAAVLVVAIAATGVSYAQTTSPTAAPAAVTPAPSRLPELPVLPDAARAVLADDPSPLVGLTLREAIDLFGSPVSVSVFRGSQEWQDDVVFEYDTGYSFFWYRDRLWQVRCGRSYRGSVFGIFIGDGADKAVSLLGEADYVLADSIAYDLRGSPFPTRARFFFTDGKISDIYVYRSDF